MSLVERLRAREPAAFREIYDQHAAGVYRFLCRLCGDVSLAHDLFQETWLQLVRFAPRLREGSNVGAWLFVVARNAFRKHRRFVLLDGDRVRALIWAMSPEPSAEHGAPDPVLESQLEDAALQRGLSRLPAGDREVLLLSMSTELSQDALAALLGISPVAFRQRLSRARRRLAKEVRRET